MWDDYAKSIGTTRNNLTQQQKIEAEVNGIMEETKFQVGDSAKYANTFSGQVSKLKANLTTMANEIGNIIKPILSAFIPAINGAIDVITEFARKIESLMNAAGIQTSVLSSLKSVSNATSDLNNNVDNTAQSLNNTSKNAKKATDNLMGFDEINKLSKNTNNDTNNDSTASSPLNTNKNISNDLGNANNEGNKLSNTLQGVINKAKELANEFKTGFSEGLGDDFNASLERTKEHLNNIGSNLKEIFTDKDVQEAYSTYYDKLFNTLGKVAGSFVSIGQSIVENIAGGFDMYLDRAKDRIKGWLVRMCNIEGETLDILRNTSQAIANIFEVIRSDVAKGITSDVISVISDTIMGASEIFAKLGRDILDLFTRPFIYNQEMLKQTILDTLEPVKTCYDEVASTVSYWWDTLNQTYDEHIAPMFENLKNGYSEIATLILDKYNQYILPVLNELAPKVVDMYENNIKPALDSTAEFLGKVADMIKEIWEKTTKPFIEWIITVAFPKVAPILKRLGEKVIEIAGIIADQFNGLFKVLGGMVDFISGVFTLNWSKAWQGVVGIFKGIWTGIGSILKKPLNAVIDDINSMLEKISGLSKISVGGHSIGLDIDVPKIPKLATGGYVSANTPQLAMIGDNTHEGEIVAPESKIAEAVSKGLTSVIGNVKNSDSDRPLQIVLQVGDTTFGQAVVESINSLTKMNGASGLLI